MAYEHKHLFLAVLEAEKSWVLADSVGPADRPRKCSGKKVIFTPTNTIVRVFARVDIMTLIAFMRTSPS